MEELCSAARLMCASKLYRCNTHHDYPWCCESSARMLYVMWKLTQLPFCQPPANGHAVSTLPSRLKNSIFKIILHISLQLKWRVCQRADRRCGMNYISERRHGWSCSIRLFCRNKSSSWWGSEESFLTWAFHGWMNVLQVSLDIFTSLSEHQRAAKTAEPIYLWNLISKNSRRLWKSKFLDVFFSFSFVGKFLLSFIPDVLCLIVHQMWP